MFTPDTQYEVHALRYATRPAYNAHEFFRFELYGDPDVAIGMDYFFWLVRGNGQTLLVDCGFDGGRAAVKNRSVQTDPLELLARMDVRPEDVDQVVISHMHYDHVGNVELFPNATVSMAREEYDFWSGPYGNRELMRILVEQEELGIIQNLAKQERLHLIDGSEELIPGVTATRLGGHTPGQLMVDVTTSSGQIVLASDAIHYYAEMELDRPFNLFTDLAEMYRGYEVLRELNARPDTTVIAGHDPRVTMMFEADLPNCLNLSKPQHEFSPFADASAASRHSRKA